VGLCQHTSKAVGHPHILAIILSQQHADYALPCAFCLAAVMVCCGEEDKRGDGDIAGDER